MAKNYNREEHDGEEQAEMVSFNVGNVNKIEVTSLSKRKKVLGYSFMAIALIMLLSYVIPDKYYTRNTNILLLNIELLIIFAKDIYLYFKKSCILTKVILGLMTAIYTLNCLDLFFNFKHYVYMEMSAITIVIGLCLLSLFSNKNG